MLWSFKSRTTTITCTPALGRNANLRRVYNAVIIKSLIRRDFLLGRYLNMNGLLVLPPGFAFMVQLKCDATIRKNTNFVADHVLDRIVVIPVNVFFVCSFFGIWDINGCNACTLVNCNATKNSRVTDLHRVFTDF